MKRAAAVLMLALLVGCQPQGEPSRGLAVVVDVIDGDTLTVDTAAGERVRVRVLGIDAPEAAKDGKPAECGASEAREALAALVDDRQVGLTADSRSDVEDRYGRRLAYVDVDGLDVGAALIQAGWAAAWHPRSAVEPERGPSYQKAQKRAQAAGSGLWSTCPTVGR